MLLVVDDRDNFRNHVPAALNLYPVADLHAETLDLIHVVQRGARYGRAANRNRLQRGNRRQFPGTPDLHQDVFDLRDSAACRVLVCDCPARGFTGEPKFLLQPGSVDFDHNAIDFVGKIRAFPSHS